jgi:hypothetical protein
MVMAALRAVEMLNGAGQEDVFGGGCGAMVDLGADCYDTI